ncbi:hypothetical protein QBC46DRAFT_434147 [Diplogelasinospora grovesii]|uniref:BZIP domain-containing protein n=1 Tax=Diplogelasinospora grovesii TaxID=303347 RepID=A0AAN6MU58_9PEZI|nr:hypothetical protein QBC46DRAFT_434147 [Diplogelasinospora grovesii]
MGEGNSNSNSDKQQRANLTPYSSKDQALKKRQGNADAQARFRRRRERREQELRNQNWHLERTIHELQDRNLKLEAKCEFYRNDRDRLREIVARTAEISGASFTAENSPRTAPPPQQQPQSAPPPPPAPVHPPLHPFIYPHRLPYDHTKPHFPTTSAYGSATPPTSLPPIAPPPHLIYGSSPPPHLSGTPRAARLPPIRSLSIRPPSPQPPGTSQHYPLYGRAPYAIW